jgi:predicted nucleic acid-binding protein
MKKIFVDTSGWANLIDARQDFHEETKEIYHSAKRGNSLLVTTNYIIAELVALLNSPIRIPRSTIINTIKGLKTSSLVEVIHIDKSLDDRAWELLSNRIDKTWSLVDCSSFVVMRENSMIEALATDHHFEQAGFVMLLK